MKVLILMALAAAAAFAQAPPGVIPVSTSPVGNPCFSPTPLQVTTPGGLLVTCQNGTSLASSNGGGSFPASLTPACTDGNGKVANCSSAVLPGSIGTAIPAGTALYGGTTVSPTQGLAGPNWSGQLWIAPSGYAPTEKLQMWGSLDGANWSPLTSPDGTIYTPPSGSVIDPSILQDSTGLYHMAYSACYVTCSSGATLTYFAIATSTDLIHWVWQQNVTGAATATAVYSPEWFTDTNDTIYIMWHDSAGNHYRTVTSMNTVITFSGVGDIGGVPSGCYDVFPYLYSGTYNLFCALSYTGTVNLTQYTSSTSPVSGYTSLQRLSSLGASMEGPAVVFDPSDSTFNLFFYDYGNVVWRVSQSTDMATWGASTVVGPSINHNTPILATMGGKLWSDIAKVFFANLANQGDSFALGYGAYAPAANSWAIGYNAALTQNDTNVGMLGNSSQQIRVPGTLYGTNSASFGSFFGQFVTSVGGHQSIGTSTGGYQAFGTGSRLCWSSTADFYGTCDNSFTRLGAGAMGVGTGAQGSIAGTVQAGVTASDPGCTTTAHIGKQWYNITTTTTVYQVCLNVAGTVGWVVK